jgi:hypothetical protein
MRWILRLVWWSDPTTKMDGCVIWPIADSGETKMWRIGKGSNSVKLSWVIFKKIQCICSIFCFVYFSLHILCFTISWRPTTKRNEDGDEPMNQPVDKMMNQYFRCRCKLLENSPIQGEFSEDNWKWWKIWDGYYDVTI